MTKSPALIGAKTAKGYPVGYGKPPQHSKFKKGKSGNPKGRPKGSKSLASALQAIFEQKVGVAMNGKSTRVPVIQALLARAVATALKGDVPTLKLTLALYEAAYPAANDNESPSTGSSFQLSPDDLAAIEKSSLLKGLK